LNLVSYSLAVRLVLILVRYIGAVFVGGVFVVLVLVLSALEQLMAMNTKLINSELFIILFIKNFL